MLPPLLIDAIDSAFYHWFIFYRNESDDIKNVVEHVTRLLDRKELFVAEHPVGIESRVQAATKLLNIQNAEDVLLLGIWGMGGIGKTTIAKAIYNEIGSKFDGKSFLLNIREFWETGTNQVSKQQHSRYVTLNQGKIY
jgi:pantothenate kinase-related protein Tda10